MKGGKDLQGEPITHRAVEVPWYSFWGRHKLTLMLSLFLVLLLTGKTGGTSLECGQSPRRL
jgi:hypothetical protein